MPGPVIRKPYLGKLDPARASVLDSPMIKALRMAAGFIGADDPASQVMGLGMAGSKPTSRWLTDNLSEAQRRALATGYKLLYVDVPPEQIASHAVRDALSKQGKTYHVPEEFLSGLRLWNPKVPPPPTGATRLFRSAGEHKPKGR